MSTVTVPIIPFPVDARELLRRVNERIVLLRRALGHDHGDAPFWLALGFSASEAQVLRGRLRAAADLFHVERATRRGRIHGHATRFASLEAQHAWLARAGNHYLAAARLLDLEVGAT